MLELALETGRLLAGTRVGLWIRVDGQALRCRHLKMTDDAMRAMHQQFAATLEGLARQNVELQNDLAQSRQQATNELAALRQEVRGAPSTACHAGDGSRCGHAFAGEAK